MALTKDSGMSAQFNRRALLKLAPALAVVPAAALSGEILPPVTETPVMLAYRQWKAASEDLEDPRWDSRSREDQDMACERVSEMQVRILDLPSERPQDFILKVMAYTYFGESGLPDHSERPDLWDEARALVAA